LKFQTKLRSRMEHYADHSRPVKPYEEIEALIIATESKSIYDTIVADRIVLKDLLDTNPDRCGILIRGSQPYSKISLKDLLAPIPRFTIPPHLGANIGELVDKIVNFSGETQLQNAVNSATFTIPDILDKVNHIQAYFKYFAKLLHTPSCFSEANRRIAINVLLLPALAHSEDEISPGEFSIDAEHYMKLPHTPRIGNGPLDYFVNAPELPPLVGSAIHIARDISEGDIDPTLDAEASPSFATSEKAGSSTSVIEAKSDVDSISLFDSLGQLFAQMLDAMKLPDSNKKRKYTEEGKVNPKENGEKFVKGILSTGQQTMFFSFKSNHGTTLPVLEYYGKYSVNFLPRKEGRQSGLFDLKTPVDRGEIENYLKAVYFFSRYAGDD
jgi:hypothetical protein